MAIKRVPERYSRLMCGYHDLCISGYKYEFTSSDDYMLEALTLSCRACVLGRSAVIVITYDEFKDKYDKWAKDLMVMCITDNERCTARIFKHMKDCDCKPIIGDGNPTRPITLKDYSYLYGAMYSLAAAWVKNGRHRAIVIVPDWDETPLPIRIGTPHMLHNLWEKALEDEKSDLNESMNAAERYFKYEEKEQLRQIRLNRLKSESEII